MQGEFINVAAHELRTPIVPILGLSQIMYSRMLKDSTHSIMNYEVEPNTTKQYLEMLETVIRNANRLSRLAEDILDVTKIESESLYLKKEFFNLNDVITNCINDILTNIGNDIRLGQSIKLEYQPCNLFIVADKSRITQVISNVLDNAIKFSKPNVNHENGVGIIIINTEKVDDQTIVTITDAGTGIEPEILPRLFDKFASKSFQGTGLGLYICKSIVQAHGGKIWAHNNNDGSGATFAFALPFANE
jgi:signal transduction histidine kinase